MLQSLVLYGPNQVEYPGKYVLRRHRVIEGQVIPDSKPVAVHKDSGVLLKLVPAGALRFERSKDDDPSIIATFI